MAADASAKQGSAMGLSVSIFQLAIAVGSLCLLVKKKPFWYASLVGAAIATAQMIIAFRG